ncbi:MAG: phospholipase D family protein [Fibrobacteria bacterium]|nr:phospholipase D family protein [Fibrobacteria bacterium]
MVSIVNLSLPIYAKPLSEEHTDSNLHQSFPPALSIDSLLQPYTDSLTNKTAAYVLDKGIESMAARSWFTEHAKETIDIQYFIFSADNVGLIACDYLLQAADRGVKIRVIVDDLLVEADAEELLALDAHENLSIKIYNPAINVGKKLPKKIFNLIANFRKVNQRMHNKAFIVDNKFVITGGRNVADEYFDLDHEYNFRDRDVLLFGKATGQVSRSFNEFWNDSLCRPVASLVKKKDTEIKPEKIYQWLRQYSSDSANFWPQIKKQLAAFPGRFQEDMHSGKIPWLDSVSYISDQPGKNPGDSGLGGGGITTTKLIELINQAQHTIHIQTPYLVTTELGQELFHKAIKRGVKIKILTNSLASTDNLEAFSGYKRGRKKLLKTGVELYEVRPDAAMKYKLMDNVVQTELKHTAIYALHAKSMVIDNTISVIGTFNLDPRSANLNTECISVIHSPIIAGELVQTIEEECKPENAWKYTSKFNPDKKAGFFKRFRTWYRRLVPKKIL